MSGHNLGFQHASNTDRVGRPADADKRMGQQNLAAAFRIPRFQVEESALVEQFAAAELWARVEARATTEQAEVQSPAVEPRVEFAAVPAQRSLWSER